MEGTTANPTFKNQETTCKNVTCQINSGAVVNSIILVSNPKKFTKTETSNNFNKVRGYAASASANATSDNMQWTKYHSPSGGHGIAAEDANAMFERACGHKVKIVGMDNAKNGADLIIDGHAVQVKCYRNGYSTLESCFDGNGQFRYSGQEVMVPKDQYAEVVSRMRQKIADGKVPGVTDPAQAEKIIRRGNITYKQAQKIRKPGTAESLAFDVCTQAKVAGFVGGLSAAYAFFSAKRQGAATGKACKEAGKEFAATGTKVLAGGVATQQILRTEVGRNAAAAATKVVKEGVEAVCQTEVGKAVVNKIAQGVGGKMLGGAAARSVATKAIRGNVITSTVMFAVDSIPDTYNLATGKMSGKDYAKSRAAGAGGVAGGSAGYFAGMAIGTVICPGIGTAIGGFVGGVAGGIGGSAAVKKLTSLFD